MMALAIPKRLSEHCRAVPEHAAWLSRLPQLVCELERRWFLDVGQPFDSDEMSCAWVAPVTVRGAAPAVLKIARVDFEGLHEIAGLRFWDGDPTVRLIAADEDLGAMLIERCEPGTHLRNVHPDEQDVVIATLLRRLWRQPAPGRLFRPLSALLWHWRDEALGHEAEWADAGLTREALSLFAELPQTARRHVLLATDLHAGNVLKADREPWLVIDPKPFVGDPAFDATQHLLNCPERLRSDPLGTIIRFADLLEVDDERVRLWMFARVAAGPHDNWRQPDVVQLMRALAR